MEGLLDAVVCPVLDVVPVLATTLRNLWGCDRDVLSAAGPIAFVPV